MTNGKIAKQLEEMFVKSPEPPRQRHIIFWYDKGGNCEEIVKELSLPDVNIEILNPSYGGFELKYRIECLQTNQNFLIYAPFEFSRGRDNWLQDIFLYSTEFSANRAALELRDLDLDAHNAELLAFTEKHIQFFDNKKRAQALKSYNLKDVDIEQYVIAFHAALCGAIHPKIEFIMWKLLNEWAENKDELYKMIEQYGDLDLLYKYVIEQFNLPKDMFNCKEPLDNFAKYLYVSTLAVQINNEGDFKKGMPKGLASYLELDKEHFVDIATLNATLDLLSNLKPYSDNYDSITNKVAEELDITRQFVEFNIDLYYNCDLFKWFDEEILVRLKGLFEEEWIDTKKILSIILSRRKRRYFDNYQSEYKAFESACNFYKLKEDIGSFTGIEAKEIIKSYTEKWYQFDRLYREFLSNANSELFDDLKENIENIYTNWFLDKTSQLWDEALVYEIDKDTLWFNTSPQWNFYNKEVEPFIKNNKRIFVIISDGMRYEVATQLAEKLNREIPKSQHTLSNMITAVPSETSIGMSLLLPANKRIIVNGTIYNDEISSQGTVNRNKILNNACEESIAVTWADLRNVKREEYQNIFKDKKVVYIYHNHIDSIGEEAATSWQIPDACNEATNQIVDIVKTLINYVSATNILVTADHGFIYQNSSLKEYDKLPNTLENSIDTGCRYAWLDHPIDEIGWHCVSTERYLKDSDLHVATPKALQRIKKQGAPKQYAHGGMSLQECIVPVLKFNRGSSSKAIVNKYIDVELTKLDRRITNRIFTLGFLQTKPTSEELLGREIVAYFVDENGQRISNEVVIIADIAVADVEQRRFVEKFTLKSMDYTPRQRCYLYLEEQGSNTPSEYKKLSFEIDIAFSDTMF